MSSSLIDTYSIISEGRNSTLLWRVRTVVKFYIWPLLVVFGLTGNCLSILVLTRRRLIRTSTNNYLTILAAFDSCYLVSTLLLNFASHPTFTRYPITGTLSHVLRPLADFSSNTATWLIVCFTLERTLAVAKPIYAKRTCSVRRSRHVIGTLLLLCFLITLPTFFEQNLVREVYDNDIRSNATAAKQLSSQQQFFLHLHRLYLVFICVVIVWIPLTLLCICNSILIWYVHRSRHFDDDLQSTGACDSYQNSSTSINKLEYPAPSQRKASVLSTTSSSCQARNSLQFRRHSRSIVQKRRVTIILIFCLFVALLLWTPQSLSLTYETFVESYSEMSVEHRVILLIFNNFANLFVCINASIDLILYCFLSEKFARTCKQVMCRQCAAPDVKTQRPRLLSMDRTSMILANPSANHHQQRLAMNTTNKYYSQLYNFYRNSSGLTRNSDKKWKQKFARSTNTSKADNQIFYQKTLSKKRSRAETMNGSITPVNIVTNPVLDSINENDGKNESNDCINVLAGETVSKM